MRTHVILVAQRCVAFFARTLEWCHRCVAHVAAAAADVDVVVGVVHFFYLLLLHRKYNSVFLSQEKSIKWYNCVRARCI